MFYPDGLDTILTEGLGGRLPALGGAESSALDDPGEVAEVLVEATLRVGEDIGDGLADGPAGRIGVVHRHLYPRAPRRDLLETDLAARHDLAVNGVPAYATVGVHLGGPGVELHALAQGSPDLPVAGVLVGHGDRFDVGHEDREVLEVGPVTVDVLDRCVYLDGVMYALCHGISSLLPSA